MSFRTNLPPELRPTPLAVDAQRRRYGPLAAADERARRRARAALSVTARLALAGALAGSVLARSAAPASAEPDATITVSNLNDAGPGSLRQALLSANASANLDTIVFASSLSGHTITLTTGRMNIDESVNIVGPGPALLTIDANGYDQIFDIYGDSKTINITISGLTLTGSLTSLGGGAIANWDENLTLDNVVISGNNASYGGAVYHEGPDGQLTIKNSEISDNIADLGGGGIAVNLSADLLIQDSVITGNQAEVEGGGISLNMEYAGHSVVIERTTIAGNTVIDPDIGAGGGIYVFQNHSPLTLRQSTLSGNTADSGGGFYIYENQESLLIQSSTISGNTAASKGGGVAVGYNLSDGGEMNIKNTTIVSNSAGDVNDSGGGIFTRGSPPSTIDSPIIIDHSIIANNTADGSGNDLDNESTANTVNRYNIRYTLYENPAKTENIVGTAGNITGQDPQLGALADNGGPTLTHLPAAASPAVNAGDRFFNQPPNYPIRLYTDQRGVYRVIGGRVDMGAVERGYSLRLPFLVRPAALLTNLLAALFKIGNFWQ
jgi:hypothetical protein